MNTTAIDCSLLEVVLVVLEAVLVVLGGLVVPEVVLAVLEMSLVVLQVVQLASGPALVVLGWSWTVLMVLGMVLGVVRPGEPQRLTSTLALVHRRSPSPALV